MSREIADSLKRRFQALAAWRRPSFLTLSDSAPLDLRIVGRTLLHAAAVGGVAGLAGAAFLPDSSISRARSWRNWQVTSRSERTVKRSRPGVGSIPFDRGCSRSCRGSAGWL